MKSLRGKAHSEWSTWILTYEHALRRKYDDSFVSGMKLDYRILRNKCERGDNPIELVKNDYIPVISAQSKVVVAAERRRVLSGLEKLRQEHVTHTCYRVCALIGLCIVAAVGFLSYQKYGMIEDQKAAERAHAQWRHDIGLDH